MDSFIAQEERLVTLLNLIKKQLPIDAETEIKANASPKSPTTPTMEEKTHAAKKIQKFWRGYQVKQAFVKNPYGAYLSMIEPNDEQRLLSSVMFGRHQAELRPNAGDRVSNPYIHESAYYHRCDNLSGTLLNQIKKEFKITTNMLMGNKIIPIVNLKIAPINEFIKQKGYSNIQIISDNDHSISLIIVPEASTNLHRDLITSGLIATPWEIAQNISHIESEKKHTQEPSTQINDSIYMQSLPRSKELLVQNDLFFKLKKCALNRKLPTHHLAASLVKLIEQTTIKSPESVARIAAIIDMANTFYTRNYQRYAFCVYAIIHELSLSLALNTDKEQLDIAFKQFMDEAKNSLTQYLGLNEADQEKITFFASPAMSGTNGFMIAKRIASLMTTPDGKIPSITMSTPCYYELSTKEFSSSNNPDIYVLSTGPIVNMDGLTPGVDINLFVAKNIIDTKRTKPATLIIDATTTLYKNLQLNENVKQLVRDGKLSIIIFESHQKFGLLHTDQAQYGRVIAWCAKDSYNEQKINDIQQQAQADFNQHLDMRIGANINHCCGSTLEQIKKQHFSNGALFANILRDMRLTYQNIVNHRYMAKNLDELYFVTAPELDWGSRLAKLIPRRNSFGHYATTISAVGDYARLCVNASDEIDILLLSAQIYLALIYQGKDQSILSKIYNDTNLTLDEQILCLASAGNLINNELYDRPNTPIEMASLYCTLTNVINACPLLKGRKSYERVSQYHYKLKDLLIGKSIKSTDILSTVQIIFNERIPLTQELLKTLQTNTKLCKAIQLNAKILKINNTVLTDWALQPSHLEYILNHQQFFITHQNILHQLYEQGLVFDHQSLVALVENKNTVPVLNWIVNNKLPCNSENIKFIKNEQLVSFIAANESLTAESFSVLIKFGRHLDLDMETMSLARDNHQFCELISIIYDANEKILSHLKEPESGSKYTESLKYTPTYLNECLQVVRQFVTDSKQDPEQLMLSINRANNEYCENVLYKDRNKLSLIAKTILRGILKAFELIIPGIKPLHHHNFFKTTSEKKLKESEMDFNAALVPRQH